MVSQILLHPYVYAQQRPILGYAAKHDIVIEAYSALTPITANPGGSLDAPLNRIANRLDATPDQVLLAWVKAKGAVVVTTSSKKSRLEGYLRAGDLELTSEDVVALDKAGAQGTRQLSAKTFIHRLVVVFLLGAVALGACGYLGIDVL